MFALAFLIGIYGYLIYALGVLGILHKSTVLISSIIFIIFSFLYFKSHKNDLPTINFKNKKIKYFIIVFGFLVFINLVGALGPELSFDALWYHLTIPKIFIQEHRIFHIQGGLFYYSSMPKLLEMLYVPGLMFGNEIIARLIQWLFGILTSIVIYKISRKFFDEKISILSSIIFYGCLVVAWQSTVAYVDLGRTFFEIMALWGFLEYSQTKRRALLIESAVLVGLAVSVKLIALGTVPIFLTLFLILEKDKKIAFKNVLIFILISLLIPLPWFFLSYLDTGNPFYPVFSGYPIGSISMLLNPIVLIRDLFNLFFKSADPVSPIFIIFLPLLVVYYKKFNKNIKLIVIYSFLSLIVWYLTPRTGGGRFILPYLPAYSILAGSVIAYTKDLRFKKYLIAIVIFVFFMTIGYRGLANYKYLSVILGKETKSEFLTKNLNFNFGDFYDTDGWFGQNIKKDDKVLLYGFHNLYYANFLFIHESYVKKGDKFNFIATQNVNIPERFSHWKLIYRNKTTGASVYTMDKEIWYY